MFGWIRARKILPLKKIEMAEKILNRKDDVKKI